MPAQRVLRRARPNVVATLHRNKRPVTTAPADPIMALEQG
jgi:hypothetical protein